MKQLGDAARGAKRLTREPSSQPRNPHLAYAFFRAGMIEAWGRGSRRIHEECRKAGNPAPVWKLEPGGTGLRLRFPFSEAWQAADREVRIGAVRPNAGKTTGKASPSKTTEEPRITTQKTTQINSRTTQKTSATRSSKL